MLTGLTRCDEPRGKKSRTEQLSPPPQRSTAARVEKLKLDVKYLLERQRLLHKDVYELEAHENSGIEMRYDVVGIAGCFLGCDENFSYNHITTIRFPEQELTGESCIQEYIMRTQTARSHLNGYLSVTTDIDSGQALLRCVICTTGADRVSKYFNVSMRVKRQVSSSNAHNDLQDNAQIGQLSALPVPADNSDALKSAGVEHGGFVVECSVDVLALYLSLLAAEEQKTSFLSSPLPRQGYGLPSCTYRSSHAHSHSTPSRSDCGSRSPQVYPPLSFRQTIACPVDGVYHAERALPREDKFNKAVDCRGSGSQDVPVFQPPSGYSTDAAEGADDPMRSYGGKDYSQTENLTVESSDDCCDSFSTGFNYEHVAAAKEGGIFEC